MHGFGKKGYLMKYFIQAVIEDKTPRICKEAHGLEFRPVETYVNQYLELRHHIPHATKKDEVNCRCVVTDAQF